MKIMRWIADNLIAPFVVAIILLFCSKESVTGFWLTLVGTGVSISDWLQATVEIPRWRFFITTGFLYALAIYLWVQYRTKKRKLTELLEKIDESKKENNDPQEVAITLNYEQAFILNEMYKLPPNKVATHKDFDALLNLGSEQRALALIESLRQLGLVLKMRNTPKGFPEFKLSEKGRQLMLQEGSKITTALSTKIKATHS